MCIYIYIYVYDGGRGAREGGGGIREEGVAAALPAEDVHAGGGSGDGRRDLVERRWHRLRRVAAAGVR